MTTVTFRNGTTVSDGSDEATTLRNGGHRTRFVPALVGTVEAASEAKNWASLLGSVVYDSEYSAKEYAVGTTCPSGSAKSWAVGTGVVAGGLYSAKYYMEQSQLFSNSALNAPGTSATSTTSSVIGTGSKTFAIQTGKAFSVGQFVIAADQTTPANYMVGQITAHNSTTGSLTVNVTVTGGSGTLSNWIISLTALASAAGAATLGGNNTYSGTNTYGAATTFNATSTFSATLDSTGVFNASGATAKRFRNSGQATFEIQNGTGSAGNYANIKYITPTRTWEMGTEGGSGRWYLNDGTQDVIAATPTATVINKPQRTDAATSANDLVRKAELDNASVQSIVTTTQGALSGFRNKIVNGAMYVQQRGNAASVAASDSRVYSPCDRWFTRAAYLSNSMNTSASTSTEGVFTALSNTNSITGSSGFATTWYHSGISTSIEHYNTVDLFAAPINLSFKFVATRAGNYSVVVKFPQNGGMYCTAFNYAVANSTANISIAIPANSFGVALEGSSNAGLEVEIGGCGGTASQYATGSWMAIPANGRAVASGSLDWSSSAGNSIRCTQVQLERGSVATPFEQRPYQVELAMCQRYYQTGSAYFDVYAGANVTPYYRIQFPVEMRSTPTISQTATNQNLFTGTTAHTDVSSKGFSTGRTKDGTTGQGMFHNSWVASAEM